MIAKRTEEITPFLVMDVLERAHAMGHEGIDVIHLEVGEPDFDTPQCVKDAACKAIRSLPGGSTERKKLPIFPLSVMKKSLL